MNISDFLTRLPISWNQLPLDNPHPLVVHFPIALWTMGTLLFVLAFIKPLKFFEIPALVMGILGSAWGYLAIESGERAERLLITGFPAKDLLARHSEQMETAFIFFAVVWGVLVLARIVQQKVQPAAGFWNIVKGLGLAFLLVANAYLVIGGHNGSRLVYEHGAGVKGFVPAIPRGP